MIRRESLKLLDMVGIGGPKNNEPTESLIKRILLNDQITNDRVNMVKQKAAKLDDEYGKLMNRTKSMVKRAQVAFDI